MDSHLVNRVIGGFAHQLRPNLTAQAYYLFQTSNYTNFDRFDTKHTFATALIYQLSDHWFGSWTNSYINNDSSQPHASYESFNTALGVTFQF